MKDPRFEVRNPEVEAKLRDIGMRLKDSVGQIPGYGFALMLFSYGEGGDFFYISSAERTSMVNLLREWIQKLEVH